MDKDPKEHIDKLDLSILEHLQEDGRKSFTEISKALDVAVGTIRNRYNKMVADGTLNIIPKVDPVRIGFNAPASIGISVELNRLQEAIDSISSFPEVSWLASVTGKYDIVVDVMCKDIDHLNEFVIERLGKVPGVRDIEITFHLKIYKVALPALSLVSVEK